VRVLHRDAVLIAVDKPAGVLTVPGRRDDSVPLSAAIRELAPEAMPVHRLDRDTSGVVVFALGPSSHRALSAAFEGRRAEKKYAALVRGDLAAARQIDLPLIEARKGSMRAAKAGETGVQASSEVQPDERFGAFTYCICSPRTGRTHQIRVHLAAIGHPLAIDPRYAEPGPLRARELWRDAPEPDAVVLDRTPLHALSLRIPHPAGGWLLLESPLPEDMSRCLDLLRTARRA
jgi:tRNA pseudouridine32 synthase/23S rRNA pseudouridine746 synthase